MELATLAPDGPRVHLGQLREQLDTVDSKQTSAECQDVDLEAVHVKDPDDNPQTVSLELSEAQTDLHEDLGSLSRPLTHPLKIHNLPDELLMNIFNNIRNRTDIKNLRMSSRRLNETSSHLLMDTLHVSPNPSSLERP